MASNKTTTSIGDRIKELREQRGFTQAELAGKLYISREKVNMWENGSRMIKGDDIAKLADTLDTTCDYILRGVSSENMSIHKATGLSENAIKKLKEFRHSRYGTIESDAVVIGGHKTIVLISLINDLIEADECRSLFTHIAGFLEYGGAFQTEDDKNIDTSGVDPKKARAYFRENDSEVVPKSNASEICLYLAGKKLKDIFRGVLEKEVNKNGKH